MFATLSSERKILLFVFSLTLFGLLILFSASGILGVQRYGSEFYYVTRQASCAAIGILFMLILSRIPYQKIVALAPMLLWIQIILVGMTLFSPFGHQAQGASRWLRIGPLSFQPSELARITVVLYMARYLANSTIRPLSSHLKELFPIGLLLLLIFRQTDLGTPTLLIGVILGMLFVAGLKWRYLLGLISAGAVFVTLSMLYAPHRRRRLVAFLDPWADPQGSGFQTLQSYISLHSGKLFGSGLGNGNSKLFYLPEVHTDFIFALIGEELGFVGACGTVLVFGLLIYLMFKYSSYSSDVLGRYLGVGLTLAFAIQIAINLGGVAGTLPVKGLPLPFLSWGRSALLVNLGLMGVFLNIIRQSSSPKL